MACSLFWRPLPSILSLVEQEHGRTIPLTDMHSALLSLDCWCWQSPIRLENDEPSVTANLTAFDAAEFGEDMKDRAGGERQRQTKRLGVDGCDWMLEELVQINCIAGIVLTVVQMRQASLINMVYPPLHCYSASSSKPKLD
jgi:hypothetical protein